MAPCCYQNVGDLPLCHLSGWNFDFNQNSPKLVAAYPFYTQKSWFESWWCCKPSRGWGVTPTYHIKARLYEVWIYNQPSGSQLINSWDNHIKLLLVWRPLTSFQFSPCCCGSSNTYPPPQSVGRKTWLYSKRLLKTIWLEVQANVSYSKSLQQDPQYLDNPSIKECK